MKKHKKRLAKFGIAALILVVVAGFLFWWQRPDLRLMYYEYSLLSQ